MLSFVSSKVSGSPYLAMIFVDRGPVYSVPTRLRRGRLVSLLIRPAVSAGSVSQPAARVRQAGVREWLHTIADVAQAPPSITRPLIVVPEELSLPSVV